MAARPGIVANMDLSAWKGRRVLITGHTGFKGAWLCAWLTHHGARVTGLALDDSPVGGAHAALLTPNVQQHYVDLSDQASVRDAVASSRPEVVFHLAAQALVRRGYEDPVLTYRTNVLGTAHLLEAVRAVGSARAVVVVTSDKVYSNDGTGRAFGEADPLGGADPYSASKAATEHVTAAWARATGACPVATARAGNVIGGGDRGRDRLLVDLEGALLSKSQVVLRNPGHTRPWQFVLDPLYGYVLLAERLLAGDALPPALNFGPEPGQSASVAELVGHVMSAWGDGTWTEVPNPDLPEARALSIDPTLAHAVLGWRARVPLQLAVEWTVEWWRTASQQGPLPALAEAQMAAFEKMGAE